MSSKDALAAERDARRHGAADAARAQSRVDTLRVYLAGVAYAVSRTAAPVQPADGDFADESGGGPEEVADADPLAARRSSERLKAALVGRG